MSAHLLISLFLTAATPFPAGSDSCVTPEVIHGQGSFAFDLTGATTGTEGQSESLCGVASGMAIEHDVWFQWMAPSDVGRSRSATGGGAHLEESVRRTTPGRCSAGRARHQVDRRSG
jgi:hypothetical protein